MPDQSKTTREQHLRDIFRTMDAHRAQEIREAYYKTVEGLYVLAESLELADVEASGAHDHALIEEHLSACQAIEAMETSLLGRIL